MKFHAAVTGLALLVCGPAAFATLVSCGSGTTAMSSGSPESFGREFSVPQSFLDCYSFSVSGEADVFGGTLSIDPLSLLDIQIQSVTLSGGSLTTTLVDTTPGAFNFGNLGSGSYQFIVSGVVSNGVGLDDIEASPVAYSGLLTATLDGQNQVPEPGSLALLGLGLAGLAVTRGSRKSG